MGQPVNPLLGNYQTMLGADPELYRQQLIQQEQARIGALPAQSQLGAQLGSLLGRGLTNVAQDRGFFEVTNPVLQNLTKIQSVYNTAMQAADPNDPLSFYRELQTRFADAGLGQQALMATQELRKVETEVEKSKGEKLRTQSAQTEVYKNNIPLLETDIAKLRDQGNNAKADELAQLRGQILLDQGTKRRKDELSMELLTAQTATERAKIRKYNAEYEEGKLDKTAIPDQNGGGVIVYYDKKTRKEVDRIVVTSAIVDSVLNKGKPGTSPSGDKPSPASFDKRNPPASSSPAASAAPASAPTIAAPAAASPYDQASGTYKIALDPEYQQIQTEARANLQRLETEPAYQAEIQQRINALQAKIKANFGTRVVIQ